MNEKTFPELLNNDEIFTFFLAFFQNFFDMKRGKWQRN